MNVHILKGKLHITSDGRDVKEKYRPILPSFKKKLRRMNIEFNKIQTNDDNKQKGFTCTMSN